MSAGPTEPKDRTTIAVRKSQRADLARLRKELGFRTNGALLNYLCLEASRGELIPPASYELVFERLGTRPVILTGSSGSGKTTTCRNLLAAWPGSVFVMDVGQVDYPELRRVDLGRFYSIDWKHENQRLRFVPNPNVEISRAEAAAVFSHLNFIKNGGELKSWVTVVEEGHRFASDANLRALLIEARKFIRKLILVTTDWRVYEGIAQVVKPPTWELSMTTISGAENPTP